MPGESQKEPVSGSPDPSVRAVEGQALATENIEKQVDAKFEEFRERLNGIDKATELLHADFVRFPTEVQKEVGHVKELFDIRLRAEREIGIIREAYRLELKADAKEALATAMTAAEKAVQTAMTAAEKARDQQTIAQQLATNKAETSFVDSLAKLTDTFTVAIANVTSSANELKDRLTTIETRQFARTEDRTTQRLDIGQVLAVLSLLVAAVAVIFAVTR